MAGPERTDGTRTRTRQTQAAPGPAAEAAAPLPAMIQRLQATAGNRAVAAMIARATAVRAGACAPDSFTNGSGVTQDDEGFLYNISINTDKYTKIDSMDDLTGFPHKSYGVADTGDIEATGATVDDKPTRGNKWHAEINGITADDASALFKADIRQKVVATTGASGGGGGGSPAKKKGGGGGPRGGGGGPRGRRGGTPTGTVH